MSTSIVLLLVEKMVDEDNTWVTFIQERVKDRRTPNVRPRPSSSTARYLSSSTIFSKRHTLTNHLTISPSHRKATSSISISINNVRPSPTISPSNHPTISPSNHLTISPQSHFVNLNLNLNQQRQTLTNHLTI